MILVTVTAHVAADKRDQALAAELGRVMGECADGPVDIRRYEVPDPT